MHVGFLLFPEVTQLDLTGPLEVLTRVPEVRVDLVWKTRDVVRAGGGLILQPTATFGEAGDLDLLIVPGGSGIDDLLGNTDVLAFIHARANAGCRFASVCTGSLLLGAAGLLKGRRAACHWSALDFLTAFGATPVADRVVEDGEIISGGGVTAGIDMALTLVARRWNERLAQAIQLQMEYDPKPPFDSGAPNRADPDLLLAVQRRMVDARRRRAAAVQAAAGRLALEER